MPEYFEHNSRTAFSGIARTVLMESKHLWRLVGVYFVDFKSHFKSTRRSIRIFTQNIFYINDT